MPDQLMRIFTSEPQLITGGSVYLRIVAASYLFTGISQIFLCILKKYRVCHEKHGDWVKRRCYQYFPKCRADFRAALFPKMGIAGAALATSISKLIEMLWAYVESLRKNRIRLRIKYCFAADRL